MKKSVELNVDLSTTIRVAGFRESLLSKTPMVGLQLADETEIRWFTEGSIVDVSMTASFKEKL